MCQPAQDGGQHRRPIRRDALQGASRVADTGPGDASTGPCPRDRSFPGGFPHTAVQVCEPEVVVAGQVVWSLPTIVRGELLWTMAADGSGGAVQARRQAGWSRREGRGEQQPGFFRDEGCREAGVLITRTRCRRQPARARLAPMSAKWTPSAAGRGISRLLRIGNETGTNLGSPDCDGRPVNPPSARPELVIDTPDDSPTLTTGAARALAGLLRAAANARLDRTEIGHSGEEPEAIAS